MKSTLVNFTFTALILGLYTVGDEVRRFEYLDASPHRLHEGFPMILYLQCITGAERKHPRYVNTSTFGASVPVSYGALVPLGLEQGTDLMEVWAAAGA